MGERHEEKGKQSALGELTSLAHRRKSDQGGG